MREFQPEARSGDPVRDICHHAAEHDFDQIFLAGQKRSRAGKALFESVTQDVRLSEDRPVLVCGDGPDDPPEA
ncbi:universal stress protein [Natronorubrum halophilum]|uniref:universal stress protein n=1 Tax=Natronorubrum halophilum TaxID=1702106 RepID=UPI000EF6ED88|nr:universal stress protein [Natronorubrum halophilum]